MKSLLASLPGVSLDDSQPIDPGLEQVIEAAALRLQGGEPINVDQLIAAHPEYADQLRELLPAVEMLVRMSAAPVNPAEDGVSNGRPAALPHKELGDFRLIREIGRGGMGTVYEAEQLSMGRRVALKVLPFAALADDKSLRRFRNEVRAAAALDHPHIVSVYSVGEERGVHFYAMQLIRGQTLADMIGELRAGSMEQRARSEDSILHAPSSLLPADTAPVAALSTIPAFDAREFYRSAARLGIQAAEALQHAHDQGVLHRDIKPGNLMLECSHLAPRDEASPGAQRGSKSHHAERDVYTHKLYITDFGLARIEADAGLTMTGDIIGTLRYMAPEQALAKRVVIDHRADVYSLGATLYELLTLQPAFGETDRSDLLKQIAFEEPRPLRKLDHHIPAELETIVLKAMAKCPDERYQTAQRLADDLRAFLDSRPIKAKPPTLVNRTAKWSRRHVAVVWSAAIILLLTSAILMASSLRIAKWYREAESQREFAGLQLKEAQRQEHSATAVAGFLQQMLASANPDTAKGPDYTVRQLLDDFSKDLGSQLADQPEVEAKLRVVVAGAYWQLENFDQSELHYKKALDLHRRAGDTNSVSTADILVGYAWCLYHAGKFDDGISSSREAIAIYRRNGSPRESTLNAMSTLHKFLSWEGKLQEADATAAEAMEIIGDLETVDLPSVAGFLQGVAGAKLKEGDYPGAEVMARRAVDLSRRLSGDRNIGTAWRLSALGGVLRVQNKLPEAEAAQREALAIFRRHYGAEHSSIRLTSMNLAKTLAAMGESTEAKSLMKQAVGGLDKELLSASVDADGLDTLAWDLATTRYEEIRDGRTAIDIASKTSEATEYKNAGPVDTLAAAYAEVGDFDAAVKWSEKAVELAPHDKSRVVHLDSFRAGKPWREP